MVRTVIGAFSSFRKNFVDLDPELTKKARASRDSLFSQIKNLARFSQIKNLASADRDFPEINSVNSFIDFGSFARKTKIKPLDDIDFLIVLKNDNMSVQKTYLEPYTCRLKLVRPPTLLPELSSSYLTWKTFTDNDDFINSTKVLNKIKSALFRISKYQKAEIKKNMQAVTLKLKSYEWNYDIVPAIPVYENFRLCYFLIPNGYGNWTATNPQIDADNTTNTNLGHNGNFLPLLRMLKYWNRRSHKPRLSSYYFETLAIKVFSNRQSITNLHCAVKVFFDACPIYLMHSCPDPKGLEPCLDKGVDSLTKHKVRRAMTDAANYAHDALVHEANSNYEKAIKCWQKVFGYNFSNYG